MHVHKTFGRLLLLCCLIILGGQATTEAAQDRPCDGNAVLRWNEIALQLMVDPGPILGARAFAIMHAAIHDAVNGVERRYAPYTADLSYPRASVDAAVATAARDVLVALSPSQREKIEASYAAALAGIPDGLAKDEGVTLGRRCAQANLDRRADDGLAAVNDPVYVPTGEPGDYDFTPPFDEAPLGPVSRYPGMGRLTPFGIDVASHGLPGPYPLESERYAKDFNHVKSIGGLESATRTADQTEIARFWFDERPTWNRIATALLRERNVGVWRSARTLALLSFAFADGFVACFEGKYQFRFWRPYTAIHEAAEDGNGLTEADPDWLPLLWTPRARPEPTHPPFYTPPFPDYPSGAAVLAAAAAEVLTDNLGERVPFEATSLNLPGVTRQFRSFSQAAEEAGLSRVYGGIHFLHAVEDGLEQGKDVGHVISGMLPRAHR